MFILHKTGMDESCYHSTHDYSQHSSIQCSITWFVGHTSKDNPMTDPGLVGAVGQAVGDFCSDFFLTALVYLLRSIFLDLLIPRLLMKCCYTEEK